MGKNLERYNNYTFYIPDDFKELWREFVSFAKKDKMISQKLEPKNAGKPISAALRVAVKLYVLQKRQEVEINEAPVATIDPEEVHAQ